MCGDYNMKMGNPRNLLISDFYCTRCGSKNYPVWRIKGKEREIGHLKNLYCLNCGRETNQIEIKPDQRYTFEDFKLEFEAGNFDEETGERKQSFNKVKELINNGELKRQKTLGNGRCSG